MILSIAPKLIGGKGAPSFLEGKGFDKMEEAIELADIEITKIDYSFKMTGYPACQPAEKGLSHENRI